MERRSDTHRKRPVTACRECHRRKQKCNRGRPCAVCVARRVPDRCTYNTPDSPLTPISLRRGLPETVTPASPTLSDRLDAEEGWNRASGALESGAAKGPRDPKHAVSLPISTKEKYCDLAMQLPPEFVVRELVDVFYSKANWFFSLLEQHYFEKALAVWQSSDRKYVQLGSLENLSRDTLYFPALLFQVLAVAITFMSPNMQSSSLLQIDDAASCDRMSEKYSDKGMEIMAVLGRYDPTVMAVEHDLIRCFWSKTVGRGKEAWHVLSSAIRMAQELGLHKQDEYHQESMSSADQSLSWLWYDEYKRRLWIKLFTWDSHMSFSLSRPRMINHSDCTIKTPLDCDIPLDSVYTVPMAPGEHARPSYYTPQLFYYAIGQIIHEVISAGLHKRNALDYDKVIVIHDRVISILNQLPSAMRPENPDRSWDTRCENIPVYRQQIINAANSFLLALHRSHARTHALSRKRAMQAAIEILNSQQALFELLATRHSRLYVLSCYTIEAGVFLAVTAAEYPTDDVHLHQTIHDVVQQAISRIGWMKGRSPLARSGEPVLKACFALMEKSSRTLQPRNQQDVSVYMGDSISIPQLYDTPHNDTTFYEPESDSIQVPNAASDQLPMYDFNSEDTSWMFESVTDMTFDLETFMDQISQFQDTNMEPTATYD